MVPSTLFSPTLGCVTHSCVENDLRLANPVSSVSLDGLVTIEGNIEICISGSYYSICDVGWDRRDAEVACRILTNNTGTYSMFTALQLIYSYCQNVCILLLYRSVW